MKKIKKIMWFMLLIVTLCVGYTLSVDASDMSADYDFDEIDELISNESDGEYSFSEIVDGICEGENGIISNTADMIWKSVTNEVSNNKEMIVRTILIAISMSILSNILSVFDNKDYSKTSYYIVYLLLMVTLISAFKEIVGIAGGMLEKIVTFMECLVPSFFLAVGVSDGASTSTGLCTITLGTITALEMLTEKIILPLISVYVIVSLISYISKENKLTKLGENIYNFVGWSVKTMIGIVMGLNIIEGMILPSIDEAKSKGIVKVASAIPGVGNSVSGVATLAVSSAEVIKNSIGAAAVVALVVIVMVPIIRLLILMAMYRIVEMIIEPISDKSVVGAIDVVYKGTTLLYKVCLGAVIMFGATIAIVCLFTR